MRIRPLPDLLYVTATGGVLCGRCVGDVEVSGGHSTEGLTPCDNCGRLFNRGSLEEGATMEEKVTTINLEPDWEGMRRWVRCVAQTDPTTARKIAAEMGSEAPEELVV